MKARTKRNNCLDSIICGAVWLFVLTASYPVYAQDDDIFEQYRKRAETAFQKAQDEQNRIFEGYRDKMNREFASYLEREWKKTDLGRAETKIPKPEPVPVVDTATVVVSRPLPQVQPLDQVQPQPQTPSESESKTEPESQPRPEPLEPILEAEAVQMSQICFNFLGNDCKVRVPLKKTFNARRGTKDEISSAWKVLSEESYNSILVDCLCLRKSLSLCDWAFFQLVRTFSAEYCGDADGSEAVLVQAYVLSQLGYKIRLARQSGKLLLLIAFDGQIYSVPYVESDGTKYYCFADKARTGGMQLCDFSFEGEREASIALKLLPEVPENMAAQRVVSSQKGKLTVQVTPNKNLMSFYDNYPQCGCDILASASLSRGIKDQLYPALKRAIASLSETQAADLLLNFVQTGFEYKTDPEQFGREKAFFGDELFFYPYCDCEDRSILFSILVRELLHLDVVLLDYPSHIATAVRFTEEVNGDYFSIAGSKYVICDPTYIGAPIGKSMPDMLDKEAVILTIK